jgi:hypothetical protein
VIRSGVIRSGAIDRPNDHRAYFFPPTNADAGDFAVWARQTRAR